MIAFSEGTTIGALLRRRAILSGDRPAIWSDGVSLTYSQFSGNADATASALLSQGIGRGDRVGLLMDNGPEFAELIIAVMRTGAIVCPLNTRLSVGELSGIVHDSGMKLLIHERKFGEVAKGAAARSTDFTCLDQRQLRMENAPRRDLEVETAPDPDEIALLIYTSGTTGKPKGVMFSHNQLLWSSMTMIPTLDMRPGDVHLLPVPMFHVGGLSFIIHCIHLNITLAIPPRWDAEAILGVIESQGANHFFAVPTMLASLLDAPGFVAERLRSVRWVMCGGAPVPQQLIERYHQLGIPLLQTMGATETGGPGLVVDSQSYLTKAGSVGRPFFHTQVRLVSEDGEVSSAGSPGEIQMRARHIASGYWNAPDQTAASFLPDGWFKTGDIGVSDEDGFISLIDRARNKIITGGENVYPAEVESVLREIDGILEVAVIGLKDEHWGEMVCAAVVVADGFQPALEDVRRACDGRLARYKHPKRLFIVETLPRNSTGKLLRGEIVTILEPTAPDAVR